MAETIEQPKPFDPIARNKEANEREAAQRAGTALPKVPQPETRVETTEPHQGPTRSQIRKTREMAERLGEERGRRLQLEEILKNGSTPAPAAAAPVNEDPEPKRAQFKDDAEFARAVNKWDARQEATKVVAKKDETEAEARSRQALEEAEHAGFTAMVEDAKFFEDWKAVSEQAKQELADDPENYPTIDTGSQLDRLIKLTPGGVKGGPRVRALVLYHFAKNPDAVREFNAMEDGALKTLLFGELVGTLKKEYTVSQASKEKPETAAERDVKLHRPSKADAPKGGTAPDITISPILADGTLNPAWKEQQNQRRAARR